MADENKNHVKPTQEELKAQELAAIEEAERLAENPEENEEEDEAPESEDSPPLDEGASEEEDIEEEVVEEEAEPSQEVKERLKREVEEKNKKLSASARENQKIYAKNRVINKALTKADEIPEPTDEELEKEFPEWEIMGDTEKILAKETVISRNWRKVISQAKEQATKIEKWNESVEEFIDDPKTLIDNPDLEGKQEEFKAFATDEANNSVPFKILTSAFLHENSKDNKPHKGSMFVRAGGGPNDKPKLKDGKISLEEARKLRETNYPKWKELLVAGKIQSDF